LYSINNWYSLVEKKFFLWKGMVMWPRQPSWISEFSLKNLKKKRI
jgi:hypothetical protein